MVQFKTNKPMTQEEKANELIEHFRKALFTYSMSKTHRSEYSKQCAAICVQEIINHIDKRISALHDSSDAADKEYWQQVLNHINSTP